MISMPCALEAVPGMTLTRTKVSTASVAEAAKGLHLHGATAYGPDERLRGGLAVDRALDVGTHHLSDLLGGEAERELTEQHLGEILGDVSSGSGGVEIGHDHVVGLHWLKATGLERAVAGAKDE